MANLDADLALLDAVVDRLDAGGPRCSGSPRSSPPSPSRSGASSRRWAANLEIEGLRVVEPWGVLTTELAEERHRAQPDLQRQADRLASRLGRARTVTTRVMVESTQSLATVAMAARTRSLR